MSIVDIVAGGLLALGLFFFLAGSIGLLRFPDAASRLHALTKADNAGLGLVALAAMLHFGSWALAPKIAAVWLFAVVASGVSAQLMARAARDGARSEAGATSDKGPSA